MEQRKIADDEEARKALLAVEREGVGFGAWARAHGLDGRSLHAWKMVFTRRAQGAARPRRKPAVAFVELVPTTPTPSQAHYSMTVGELSFEFGDDAQEGTLRRVIVVLRSC